MINSAFGPVGALRFKSRLGLVQSAWLCAGLAWLCACAPVPASPAPDSQMSPAATQAPGAPPDRPIPTGDMRAAAPPTSPDAQPLAGRLEITSYHSRLLDEELPLLVYLPPGFGQAAQQLPVLYLLHGRGYDEWQWVDLGATRLATQAIRGGLWPGFAIVMPFQPEPLFSSSDGGERSYEAEFLEGLMPAVESRFNLVEHGSGRAIAGISRGGVWALEIAFRHPQEFSGVAALSPTLNLNFARPPYDPLWIVQQAGPLPGQIFLAAGDREQSIRASAEQLSQALEQQGVQHEFSVKPGTHAQELWTALLEPVLGFLVSGWAAP
ncbi:MAG TPA: alpha/beta hydrolase-fold protein [Anaerolineales bacterium]|nr:alpha/beta hydrolase-fold protein [Anaerolineales bacterium]